MFAQGLRIAIMLLLLLGGGVFPRISSPPSTSSWAQATEQGIQCEVLRFGIGERQTGRELPPSLRSNVDRALVFTGAIRTQEPVRFLTDAAIITDRGFAKRSLLGWVFRPSRQPTLPLNPDSVADYMRDTYSPPFRVHIDLSKVKRNAYAGGVAVVWDLPTEELLGLCSVFTGVRAFDLPTARRAAQGGNKALKHPDLIFFTNEDGLVLPQHRGSLLLGFNTGPLWVEGNTGEITVGFNLGPQVPLPNGSQGAGEIEIANNTGSIRLGSNFGPVTIHSNEGVILIEANRSLGQIIVRENRGTLRVLENQGEIEDPTGTVEVGRSR